MNIGEPPGRDDREAETPDDTRPHKPARIVVRVDFDETETDIGFRGRKGMLDRPLRDMLDAATVRTAEAAEGERPTRKPIGVFQGLTARRIDGLMRYEASVSATSACADEVRENILRGVEGLQRTFKHRLENVEVAFAGTSENAADGPDAASVELRRAAPVGNDQSRQSDGDAFGAEHARV